jgi:transketolase
MPAGDAARGADGHPRVIYVMTHDSIGLGEDGPTHQPVEHLAALRAMPNLRVFRPCDAVETAECWQLALENTTARRVLALTRQNLPQLRTAPTRTTVRHGAYEMVAGEGEAKVSLFASGSEVEIAVAAQKLLPDAASRRAWCRCPRSNCCWRSRRSAARAIIGDAPVKVAIEAAVRFGWDAVIGRMANSSACTVSAPARPTKDLYKHFGITPRRERCPEALGQKGLPNRDTLTVHRPAEPGDPP